MDLKVEWNYENSYLSQHFNVEIKNENLRDFQYRCSFASLIDIATCYKNLASPSCFDLISTNCQEIFQNSIVTKTGLSNYHMIGTITKTNFYKLNPNTAHHGRYDKLINKLFRGSLNTDCQNVNSQILKSVPIKTVLTL